MKHQFLVNPRFAKSPPLSADAKAIDNAYEESQIIEWFERHAGQMLGSAKPRTRDALVLCEELILTGQKDFFIWDDLIKGAEMKFLLDSAPLLSPTVDICCGYGFWIGKTLQGIDVGVDLYPDDGTNLYRRPIEGFPEKGFTHDTYFSVLQADITKKMPVPEGFFKTAICICALEHIEDSQGALREMARILAPNGGRLLLTLQPQAFMQTYVETFQQPYVREFRDKHAMVCDRDAAEWKKLLEAEGFRVQKQLGRLSRELILFYALTFYPHGLEPILQLCPFDIAYKECAPFREAYRKQLSQWISQEVPLSEAGLLLFECVRV